MSSSEDESDMEEEVMSHSEDGDDSVDRKKRPILVKLRASRKKTRSMDEEDFHTGLSPRMNRMDIVSCSKTSDNMGVFFLDDGVETISVDGDPRMTGVREIYSELDRRLERAAVSAGLNLTDPAVGNLKKQLALRAAELEANLAGTFGGPSNATYRDSIYRVISWIQSASEAELKEVLDGRMNNLSLENRPQAQSPQLLQASAFRHGVV